MCWSLSCRHPWQMMTSSNGNIFRVTGPLCGEFTGPVNSPHKSQWRGALMFSLICARINDWVNKREAGDLRRHRGHYDVSVMQMSVFEGHCLVPPFPEFEVSCTFTYLSKYSGYFREPHQFSMRYRKYPGKLDRCDSCTTYVPVLLEKPYLHMNSPAQRPATRSFDVFFDPRLNKRLRKQSWGWWFETPSRSYWRHRNVSTICCCVYTPSTYMDTLWFRYNAIRFLQNSHNRRPIPRPLGPEMGCLSWVRNLIHVLVLTLHCYK